MTTPSFDAIRRAVELMHGTQAKVISCLSGGGQLSAEDLRVDPTELDTAVHDLISAGIIRVIDARQASPAGRYGPMALTDKGIRAERLIRELALGDQSLDAPTGQ